MKNNNLYSRVSEVFGTRWLNRERDPATWNGDLRTPFQRSKRTGDKNAIDGIRTHDAIRIRS